MNMKSFVIELYIIFLGITLTKAIEIIVLNCTYFSIACFVLIYFLAIDFFFAKIRNIGTKEKQTGMDMAFNLLVVCCFSFMPHFMTSFPKFMIALLFLRVFDAMLIIEEYGWKLREINRQVIRWLMFDTCYFFIEIIFIIIDCCYRDPLIDNVLITIYLILGIFESVFDFVINSKKYLEIEQEG